MKETEQREKLSRNYEELEEDKKETLLEIGENFLNIQNISLRKKACFMPARKGEVHKGSCRIST